ncbi:MAG: hydroxysqualene dehydroxylase HpnE, partial [Dehalococcoidia bacterium]
MSERSSVLVAGGGLAGLAAACELANRGKRVTLLEKRPFLGGRTFSHIDKRSGLEIDNGQHVFLGCCAEYINFLKRLNVYKKVHLQKRLRVRVIDKVWGESVLEDSGLPAPLQMRPSLVRFRSLSFGERVRAIWAFSRIRSLNRRKQPELDGMTFGEWLRREHQTPNSIGSLWNLIIQPTLNDDVSQVSADLALMVLQEGFLHGRDGANVGWSKVGLSALLAEAAQRYIEDRGGEVRLGLGLDSIEMENGAVRRVLAEGGELTADSYVLALPVERLLPVLPLEVRKEPFFSRVGRIEMSPIVHVHLWYDRPVWGGDFAAFLNTPLQWVFNKSKLWGQQDGGGQYLDISLSGAHDFAGMPATEIVDLFTKEVRSLLPAARGANLKRTVVVKQRDATFAPRPGIAALRPSQRTPVENLFLAGDWTDTGWPATMESAVRSGLLAARAVLRSGGRRVT